jgi:hypothetical protein
VEHPGSVSAAAAAAAAAKGIRTLCDEDNTYILNVYVKVGD